VPPELKVYTGSNETGPFVAAELRLPTDAVNSHAGLLILRLGPQRTITAEQVIRRYGDLTDVEPPHPGAPLETPTYYRYVRPNMKGSLSFGIRDDHVVSVVLDRYPQPGIGTAETD
jgi:hypothetical protein